MGCILNVVLALLVHDEFPHALEDFSDPWVDFSVESGLERFDDGLLHVLFVVLFILSGSEFNRGILGQEVQIAEGFGDLD